MTFQEPPLIQPSPVRPATHVALLPSLEHLWVLLALTLVGVFIALVPTTPHDFWWHLKAGQLVAESGIPTTNLFAWTLPADTPFTYATWLSEWLFYALYQLGGLPATVLARNLLGLAGFALVAVEARRRSGSWRMAALAALLAGAMTINNLTTRTQNWAWVPFGLYMLILGAYTAGQASWRTLLALPPLMAFWVNVHGSFVLGLALIGLFATGETLRRLLGQPHAMAWNRLAALYLAGAATTIAALLNPRGIGIFSYVAQLTSNSAVQSLVSEWQPPTTRSLAGQIFFISVLAVLAAFGLGRRRPTITDMLLVGALLWQALGGQRHVGWYGMLAMPILAQSLAAPRPATPRPARRRRLSLPGALLALMLLAALVAVQPPLKARLPLPQPYQSLFVDLPGGEGLFSTDTPVAAAAYLRANPGGRLFNDMGYGAYLDWALYPTMQVFVDPRIELYDAQLWQDYVAIGDARGYHTLLVEKYGVTRVLLDRGTQPRLAAALADDVRWEREYADARAEIYRRR